MDSGILGIPAQTIMDMLTVIINGDSRPPVDLHDGKWLSPHCSDIIGYAVVTSERNRNSTCYPADPTKYPDWKCLRANSVSVTQHAPCMIASTGIKMIDYCACSTGYGLAATKSNGLFTLEYYTGENAGNSRCPHCENGHGKRPPCPACGEFHE